MIILASASPRRRELIKSIFNSYVVRPAGCDEITIKNRPRKTVEANALSKALAVKAEKSDTVISADTIVYMKGKFYLKPSSIDEAKHMLAELSGKKHYVYTGVCILNSEMKKVFSVRSSVVFKKLTDTDIDAYCADGSPMGKAGAYGIQDNFVVKKYYGSYSNIVGLPMEKLLKVVTALRLV